MLKMVDGTGIIGVDMICPLGISTPQPPNYDRVELEGTGMLVLPNSLDAPLERLELGGKTEQVQTTGKNLFDIKTYHEMNGCEIIDNNQISFVQNLAKINYEIELDAGDYLISFSRKKYSSITIRNGETVLHTNGGENNYSFHIKLSELATIGIEFASGQNPNSEQRIVYNIQLEKGATATPYEPYTGGKPSPSPEYTQEIKNSGKWNEETQKYEVDVNITGKNLFDKCLLEGGEIVEFNGVECYKYKDDSNNFKYKGKFKNGQQYALTTRILRPESKKSYGTYIKFKYEDGTDSVLYAEHGGLKTLVSNIGKTIDSIIGNYNYSTDCYLDLSVTRLSRGGQDSGYQPYKEQTLTFTSDRPITKWDRLVEQGGQIGWLYGSVIATIDETASISLYAPNGFYVYVKNIDKKEKTGYCDKLYAKKMSNGEPFVLFGNANNNGLYTLNTQEFYGKTVSEIRAKLKEYPLNIIGKSETTEFIPLPQSEQNAIRALKTYYPTTVITADGGELDPDIKVTYRKEI